MNNDQLAGKKVLITGGTSGLGKSLAIQLKEAGCKVHVIGTNGSNINQTGLSFMKCDFASFHSVIDLVNDLEAGGKTFDLLINNAGILSPPDYNETIDGFELTYQVNFLSHVLLTRYMQKKNMLQSPVIVNTSSPIYKSGTIDGLNHTANSYSLIKAYANTKLYMALWSDQLAKEGIRGFAFDPGTFSSGIYRSQKNWFHLLYKVASPILISSEAVAIKMIKILHENTYSSGKLLKKNGSEIEINKFSVNQKKEFWGKINTQLDRYF